jgi:hypothetical protein
MTNDTRGRMNRLPDQMYLQIKPELSKQSLIPLHPCA